MTVKIIQGDCREVLATLPDESFHCCITSPPYFGLRDYGVEGQIGLEATVDEYIAELVAVFREVRRVLRKDAVLFCNMGDAYAGSWGAQSREHAGKHAPNVSALSANQVKAAQVKQSGTGFLGRTPGLKPKDLIGLPFRLAFALQADGWWLRSAIPWLKRNSMPESVTDRPASSVEYVFMFSKSQHYFWDFEAVRRKAKYSGLKGQSENGYKDAKQFNGKHGSTLAGALPERERRSDKQRGHGRRHNGFNDCWDAMEKSEQRANGRNFRNSDLFFDSLEAPHGLICDEDGNPLALDVPPSGFKGAHFATFPANLVKPLIQGGCPLQACSNCGAPFLREIEKHFVPQQDVSSVKGVRGNGQQKPLDESNQWHGFPRGSNVTQTKGFWPSCKCEVISAPGRVLDIFGGAATTGVVADRLQRDATLIELNSDYVEIAKRRLSNDQSLFASVEVA